MVEELLVVRNENTTEGKLTLHDLEKIKEEFEAINQSYRQSFSFQARLDLLERVKKLVAAIKDYEGSDISKD